MSDPVTQAEIEDVLSSIRRLVSEDGRSGPRPVTGPAVGSQQDNLSASAPQAPAKPTSRLVLTPALRVAEDTCDAAEAGSDQPEAVDVSSEAEVEASWGMEAAYDLQGVSHLDLEVEPELDPGEVIAFRSNDTVEVDGDADLAADQYSATEQSEAEPAQAAEGTEPADAAPWRDPEATLFGSVDSPPMDAAEAEMQLSPQISETVAEQGQNADDARLDLDEADVAEPEADELDGSQRVSAVVQKIAELEAKVARSTGQWEPDGASSDPYAGTNIETLEWQDHTDEADIEVEAESEAEVATGQVPQPESGAEAEFDAAALAEEAVTRATMDALGDDAAEESYLDEESLRELVADIVRSELQGALGERITRNVRKLVRREIQRALAAQDLI
jgi:cell pole-organizing protein PopZ